VLINSILQIVSDCFLSDILSAGEAFPSLKFVSLWAKILVHLVDLILYLPCGTYQVFGSFKLYISFTDSFSRLFSLSVTSVDYVLNLKVPLVVLTVILMSNELLWFIGNIFHLILKGQLLMTLTMSAIGGHGIVIHKFLIECLLPWRHCCFVTRSI